MLFLLSASVGVAMIGLGIVWPLVPVYAAELGAGGFQVGLIIASFNIESFTMDRLASLTEAEVAERFAEYAAMLVV